MSTQSETGEITGTNIHDAERDGDEFATFFRKAQADSRKGADEGKRLLRERLAA